MILDNNINPFEFTPGSSRLSKPWTLIQMILGALLIGLVLAKLGILGVVLCFGVFIMLGFPISYSKTQE